jgi:hypothetical protein
MSILRFNFYALIALSLLVCASLETFAQGTGLRLPLRGGPTYPGNAGLPSININDAHPAFNAPLPSGSPTQILQQNFPVPLKSSDADTFMPVGLLEKSLGPLTAPRKETHIY